MFAEGRKALGGRTIIEFPAWVEKCANFVKETNRGIILTRIGKESEILMLSIFRIHLEMENTYKEHIHTGNGPTIQ